jgi:hypothetical protein
MKYTAQPDPRITGSPNVLYQNNKFLSESDIVSYQNLLRNSRWTLGNNDFFEKVDYLSQDLYQHYKWDGNWNSVKWLDNAPVEWETLYYSISQYLPEHFAHWIDVKITGFGQSGTPIHRDKDPWHPGGDSTKFNRAITVICNLNSEWLPSWGGGLVLYDTDISDGKIVNTANQTIPISPGQLLVVENCYHSIEAITKPAKSRVSFILHVLEYCNDSD